MVFLSVINDLKECNAAVREIKKAILKVGRYVQCSAYAAG